MKYLAIFAAAVILAIGAGGTAFAFHSGGVAECGGCHSMHSAPGSNNFLLVGTDQSSACLTCHAHSGDTGPSSYHIMTYDADAPAGTAPLQRTPGGDFGWTRKTYSYVLRGENMVEPGDSHGHNIVARDMGMTADATKTTAPGGTFPSSQLACNSCHDPHGKYRRDSIGNVSTGGAPIIASGSYNTGTDPGAGLAVGVYRLLAGSGYAKAAFPGVPVAIAPSTYNRTEALTQTRVAYGTAAGVGGTGVTDWGKWCATCHTGMHSTGGKYVHPVDETLGTTMAATYDTYKGSGVTRAAGSGYISLVPFMEGGATYATLRSHAKNDGSYMAGPASGDQVSCLSCHRAHASGFKEMLRWNMEGEMILVANSWPGTDAPVTAAQDVKWSQGRTYAEMKGAYYEYPDNTFSSYQRVLCNKCHAKD